MSSVFAVADLNAIETRVGAWVSGCEPLLRVFAEHRDPYLDFANKMTGIPYEVLAANIKSKDPKVKAEAKRIRQIAKPGVLGAIYRLSGGKWGKDKNGDIIKTGMWGYAEGMNVDMTREQAHEVVKIFRESYHEIVEMWGLLEVAVADVLTHERTVRYIGPEDCVKIDKVTIEGRDPMLRIQLPSGRYLHYLDASIQETIMPWKKKGQVPSEFDEHGNVTAYVEGEVSVFKPSFTYYGLNQDTKQWDLIVSHGGKIFENIVQAIARDVLAECALRITEKGMEICGHVHDEIIALTEDDPFEPGADLMQVLMSIPMQWAPSLPLGAEAFESEFYHK